MTEAARVESPTPQTRAGRKDEGRWPVRFLFSWLFCFFFFSFSFSSPGSEVIKGSFDLYLAFCTIRAKLFGLLVCSASLLWRLEKRLYTEDLMTALCLAGWETLENSDEEIGEGTSLGGGGV